MFSKSVLTCAPRYFTVRDVKNPFMEGSVIDTDRAQAQWEVLRGAIQDAGVSTRTIEPVPDLEDMVFAANQAFIGATREGSRFVIMSRMRHPSRQREVPYYRDWFRTHGYEELDIDLRGEYLEGHGDLLWHPGRRVVWAGYGQRSTRGGLERITQALEAEDIAVRALALTEPRFYHLDTCLSPLSEDAAIVFPGA
jgi:N-dimethylarginine dimethylaminohydrolase